MCLLDNGTGKMTEIPCDYCFLNLFRDCGGITTVSANFLSMAKTITSFCYENMFCDCMSLNKAPDLPVETLHEYCCCNVFMVVSN